MIKCVLIQISKQGKVDERGATFSFNKAKKKDPTVSA